LGREKKRWRVVYLTRSLINLQDTFLNQVRKENIPVVIYLINGFQLKGSVKGFDNFTVVIEYEGKQQLVYKHAISTVAPIKNINMVFNESRKEDKNGV
jgi:host factor-I protein